MVPVASANPGAQFQESGRRRHRWTGVVRIFLGLTEVLADSQEFCHECLGGSVIQVSFTHHREWNSQ